MRRRSFLKHGLAVVGAGLIGDQSLQGRPFSELSYSPALYFDGYPGEGPSITVFPFVGEAVLIPMPLHISSLVTDHGGRSLYVGGGREGIFRLEFNPTRLISIAASEKLGRAEKIVSIDENSAFLSGTATSGAFALSELNLHNGDVRQIFASPQRLHYVEFRVLPDRSRALGNLGGQLQIIDLKTGVSKPILEDFRDASWSPDGRWVAAMPRDYSRAVLLKAADFLTFATSA